MQKLVYYISLALEGVKNSMSFMLGGVGLFGIPENIIVAMMHRNKMVMSKLLKECSLTLSGVRCVKKIVTNLVVIDITEKGFRLLERATVISIKQIKNATEDRLIIDGEITEIDISYKHCINQSYSIII